MSADLTLPAFVDRQLEKSGDKPAIFYGETAMSYAELSRLSRIVARSFADLGVRRGDRVAVWLPNIPAWHICLLACSRLGAAVVALNTRFRSAELAEILGRADAKILVLWPDFRGIDFVPVLEECDKAALDSIKTYLCYSEGGVCPDKVRGKPAYSWQQVIAQSERDQDDSTPESGCVIFSTSGTTSAPKLGVHTQQSICRHAIDTVNSFGYDAADAAIMVATPMCGTSGFGMGVAGLAAGRPQIVAPLFDEVETARLISEQRVTHMHATHHILRRLFAAVPENNNTLSTLRLVNCGSGAPAMVEMANKRGICVVGIYGSTEVQARFSRQAEALPLHERGVAGGRPLSDEAVVRARSLDSGRILPHGEDGELEIKAPSMIAQYLGNAEANRRAFTEDRFVRTGDLGHTLSDGRFVFISRIGDVLRLSGFLVSPIQIERVIEEYPSIEACQIVGIEVTGNLRPFAFVRIKTGHGFDESQLTAYCRQKMAPYKTPVAFHRLDQFPVTEGPNQTKVQKAKLREMAGAIMAGKSSH